MSHRRTRRRSRPDSPPAAQPAAARQPGPPFALAALALLAAALALYWGALRHPLVFDDFSLRDYLLRTYYAEAASRFGLRWVSDASFWWIHQLFGRDPLWQRLANVVLHAGAAAALYGFFSRLFRAVLDDPRSQWLALAGALFFLLHPAAVYGVAYLIERSIILATLFSVLALWCVLEGLLRRSAGWYAAAAAAYFLAVYSKEHAVMVPAVAAALALLVHGASLALARRMAWAFGLFAAVGIVMVLKSRGVLGTAYEPFAADVFTHLESRRGAFDAALAYPLSVVNQATLFFRYLLTWLLPWPGWMSVDVRTAFPQALVGWPHAAGFLAWLAYPVGAAWLLLQRRRLGLLGFALLYPWLFALTEVVTVRAQEPFVLYRSYLWMSGLPAIVPLVAGGRAARWRIPLAAAVALVLAVAARERLDSFSSPLKLWNDAISKNADPRAPYVERAYIARGYIHFDAGRPALAGADFDRALELNPRSPDAYVARGSLRLHLARLAEALADMDRAIALDPGYASAYDKRCAVKMGLNRPLDAVADCDRAVTLDPKNHEAWINRGVLYHRWLKRAAEAAASYERALDLEPESGAAHFNYGMLLVESGRRDEAVRRHFVIGCRAGIRSACDVLERSRRQMP
jgi:tetratricopeptide (TPR) repeat protein